MGLSQPSIIKTDGLTKYYEVKKQQILGIDNLNINIKKGEIFGLLGTNGAGKTTTIKLLSTLLYPTSGTAYIHGLDIRYDGKEIRRLIGVVFSGLMIYHRLTGRANLEFYGDLYDVPDLDQRIGELAKFFELEDRIDHRVETYSKGMKLMLALMRGIIHNPDILFLDEPTLGLDPNKALKMREKIKELKEQGKTIILTTHYMFEAEDLCDRVAILNKGKLVAIDTPKVLRRKIPGKNALEVEFENTVDINRLKEDFILTQDKMAALIPIKDSNHLNSVLKEIVEQGLVVKHIRLIEPSLETVFTYYTK